MQFVIRKSIGQNTVSTNAYIMSNIVGTIDEEEIKNEYEIQDVLFVLMITQNLKKTLLMKWKYFAIIVAACTKTVVRVEWFLSYLENLADTLLNQFEISGSHQTFEFGDGCKVIPKYLQYFTGSKLTIETL